MTIHNLEIISVPALDKSECQVLMNIVADLIFMYECDIDVFRHNARRCYLNADKANPGGLEYFRAMNQHRDHARKYSKKLKKLAAIQHKLRKQSKLIDYYEL